jgi:predicted phage tail protein
MMTLLYGEKPGADVEPGNRVDLTNGGAQSPPPMTPPRAASESPHRAQHEAHFALRDIVFGLVAVSAVLAGITAALVALVWSPSIAPGAQVALFVVGVFMFSGGIAYVISNPTKTTSRAVGPRTQ